MIFISPKDVKIQEFEFCIERKEHADRIHLPKYSHNLFRRIEGLTVAHFYKIVKQKFFCLVPALPVTAATVQVFQKIQH